MRLRLKTCIIGDSSVGKTALAARAVTGEFTLDLKPTIGSSHFELAVETQQGSVVYGIWDTAGSEQFRSLAPLYLQGAQVVIFVFSLVGKEARSSFNSLTDWADMLNERSPGVDIALVGNKSDLLIDGRSREVSQEEAELKARDLGALFYIETSARTGQNVEELFKTLALHQFTRAEQREDVRALSGDLAPTGRQCHC